MKVASCAVLFHNYYGGHENWVRFFCEKIKVPFTLYYNIVEGSIYGDEKEQGSPDRMERAASGPFLKKIVVRRSPNQGKDIGGKLVLLDACMRGGDDDDYIIFLHDKKSPHKVQAQEWSDKLFRVVEPRFIEKAISLFDRATDLGIVSPGDAIINEYDPDSGLFVSNNRSQLTRLRSALQLTNTDYRYVAGTMFWCRALPLLTFFTKYPPLDIRKTLEKGNIMDDFEGTNTHAWERLLSWLIFAQGYTIKGL